MGCQARGKRREGFPANDRPPLERRVWRPGMVLVGKCYPCGVEEFVNQEQLQTHHSERHGDKYCCHHYWKEFVDETRLTAHYMRTRHSWSPEILDNELTEFEEENAVRRYALVVMAITKLSWASKV